MIYCPSMGTSPDGICGCGQPATTEIQVGWYNASRTARDSSGGQYEEMCEECYQQHLAYEHEES